MSTSSLGPFARAWTKWKSLNLPWRTKRLVGQDLVGNTFWVFRDSMNANRLRRIAQQPRRSNHFSEFQISPQWHQWLRYTREEPPSLQEQRADVQRQLLLKKMARLADERWESKASYLGGPANEEADPKLLDGREKEEENPWKAKKGGPGEEWKPRAWKPSTKR